MEKENKRPKDKKKTNNNGKVNIATHAQELQRKERIRELENKTD